MSESKVCLGTSRIFLRGFDKGSQLGEDGLRMGKALALVPEPTNSYDRHAIKVLNGRGEHVGRVARELSRRCSQMLATADELGVEYNASFVGFGHKDCHGNTVIVQIDPLAWRQVPAFNNFMRRSSGIPFTARTE